MNTFKKIAAVTLAAATLATTMITASAADKVFKFDTTGNVYGNVKNTDNYIHFSQLDYFADNIIKYQKVEKNMMEGNVILTVDFAKDPTARRKAIAASDKPCVDDYMESLYIETSSGGAITSKHALEVIWGAKTCEYNVIVSPHYELINNFDVTGVSLTPYSNAYGETSTDSAWLNVEYKINGKHILIGEHAIDVYGTISNTKFTRNFSDFYSEGKYTKGQMSFLVPLSYAGSTRSITVNGAQVGTVTLPKLPSSFRIGFDRYRAYADGSYKNY